MNKVKRYRKRPGAVEAIRCLPGVTCDAMAEWMGSAHDNNSCSPYDAEFIVLAREHMRLLINVALLAQEYRRAIREGDKDAEFRVSPELDATLWRLLSSEERDTV